MKEIKRKKRQPNITRYIATTTEELNVLLDGCEDTLKIITDNPTVVGFDYRARLKRIKKRIEDILKRG